MWASFMNDISLELSDAKTKKLMDLFIENQICRGGAEWRRLVYSKVVKVNGTVVRDWDIHVKKDDVISLGNVELFIVE